MPLASTVSGEVLHYPPLKEMISNLNLVTHQQQNHGQVKAIVDLASHQVTFRHSAGCVHVFANASRIL
jgi:hypothetical protein